MTNPTPEALAAAQHIDTVSISEMVEHPERVSRRWAAVIDRYTHLPQLLAVVEAADTPELTGCTYSPFPRCTWCFGCVLQAKIDAFKASREEK